MSGKDILRELYPQRIYTRLRGYDYSQPGFYFVTICTHDHSSILGSVETGQMGLSAFGGIVHECWKDVPRHYGGVTNDLFIVMPNHVHGIIVLRGEDPHPPERSGSKPDRTEVHSLSEIVRGFKTYSARRINDRRRSPGVPVWQRGFYEHVVRNDHEYRRIGEYIRQNPERWETDLMNEWPENR